MTLLAGPGRADDLSEGLEAYDAGDLAAAGAAWRKAAQAGDLEAMVALAGLYERGDGVPVSIETARDLYRRAAEQGHAVVQLNLGDSYSHGPAADRAQAYLWLSLAVAQGRSWPAGQLRALIPHMTPQELLEGKRLLAAWQAR